MCFKKIGIVLSGLLLVWGMSGCMKNNSEKEILNYLEEKYNQDFTVESFYESSKLEYEFGNDKMIVHPNSDEKISFLAGQVNNSKKQYFDNYVLVKLAKELTEELEEFVANSIQGDFNFIVRMYAPDNSYDESMINENPNDIINKLKDKMDLGIKIAIEVKSEDEIDRYIDGLFNLYNKITNFNTEFNHLSVGFVSSLSEVEEYIRVSNSTSLQWKNLSDNIMVGELNINENSSIKEIDDIRKNYKAIGEY